jgi:hypothetical protein
MSDYRAVAAVMMTLQNMLQEAIREAVPGAVVQTGPPEVHSPDQVGAGLIKIFLYKVEPNPTWRNAELPVRGADGRLLRRPQMAVNLDLLLSFYGDEREKVPYVLLGLTLAALHAEPYPDVRFMPRQGDGDAVDRVSASLAGSGLDRQQHALSLSLLPLTHEELVPLFSQIPYVMSVAYRAQVVLIEPFGTPQPPLPVRRAELWVAEGRPPVLAAVAPPVLAWTPGAEVVLRGEGLTDGPLRVRFGELEAVPEAQPDGSLRVALPDGVQAGTTMVRAVRETTPRGAPRPLALESDPVALVVQPVVRGVSVSRLPPGEEGTDDEGAATAELQVRFAPPVAATRQGLVLLHPRQAEGEPPRRSLALPAVADAAAPDRLTATGPVPPGEYKVRVQVNGVTSPLLSDDGGFTGPWAVVP